MSSGRTLAGLALLKREKPFNETGSITQTFQPSGNAHQRRRKGTSPDRLTGTDVMAAIGTTSSRARFGLAAFFGKPASAKRMNSSQFRRWRDCDGKRTKECSQSSWWQVRMVHADAGAICLC
jgi:hypothetical protein